MSAPLPLRAPDIELTRTGLLAAASVVLATCSVAVTIAVSSSGGTDEPAAAAGPRFATGITAPAADTAKPETAKPDAATIYHHQAMERRR